MRGERDDIARKYGQWDVARRPFLRALGAGAAISALTGAAGARSGGALQSDEIDPVFGFSALTPDTQPPVEPDHEVNLLIGERSPIPEFFFEPTGLVIESGDTVKFTIATPEHTVTAYHPAFGRTQRVPNDVPPVSSPVLGAGAYWLYTFETEGVYDLFCAPHEFFGMAFRLVVGEPSGPGAEPVSREQPAHGDPRPPVLTAALVLSDSALDPSNIVDSGSVSWNDIREENKRLLISLPEPEGEEMGTETEPTTEEPTTQDG